MAETGGWVPREPRGPTSLDDLGDEELPAAVASRALGTAAAPVGEESWVAETCVAALELWLGSFVRELRAARTPARLPIGKSSPKFAGNAFPRPGEIIYIYIG